MTDRLSASDLSEIGPVPRPAQFGRWVKVVQVDLATLPPKPGDVFRMTADRGDPEQAEIRCPA